MPTLLTKPRIKIGPQDHGRRMPLAEFDRADAASGYLYELDRGAIDVSDVPGLGHFHLVMALRNPLLRYQFKNPDVIYEVAQGCDSKLVIEGFESERHPDILVYLSPPPEVKGGLWAIWIPGIVVEVVSSRSRDLDYHAKREEYLAFGVREYWIVDGQKREILALRRQGGLWREQIVKAAGNYRTPLLPGFVLSARKVFAATRKRKK